MRCLADKWRQADATEDILQSAKDFNQTMVEREMRAGESLARMRAEDVPQGIQSCMSRGGRILGLPLDSAFLGTRALSEFLEWCDKHDLRVAIEPENQDQTLLLISPKECL
jgi:molybdopterin-guanine dinucleotide biosynthesis protein A